ncbi:MAG TPA: histidine kinase [Actinomycetota bacterium]|nr:histidine kinase [Actinomycetota bacterium]
MSVESPQQTAPDPPANKSPARLRPSDFLVALLIGFIQITGTIFAARHGPFGPEEEPIRRSLDALAFVLLAAGPAALVVRHRFPAAVLVGVFGTTLLYWLIGYPKGPIFLALLVAFLTAMRHGRRMVAWLVLGAGYFGFLWLESLLGLDEAPSAAEAVGLAAWLLVLGAVAEWIRVRREYVRAVEQRALEAERTREEEARRRATEERLRIAREVHDVLAHNISLINVQAGVALHLMADRPEQARTALSAIKDASGEVLRELRSTLGVLRQVDEQAPLEPSAGLARLDDVIARAEAAGLRVQKEVDGEPRPLPAGVDLAAFRIVQEALTNVARHAGPATATVRLAYGARDLTVQIDDDGRGAATRPALGEGGAGILGMRERTAALGGEFEAGPRPEGGFRVRAKLPVDGRP